MEFGLHCGQFDEHGPSTSTGLTFIVALSISLNDNYHERLKVGWCFSSIARCLHPVPKSVYHYQHHEKAMYPYHVPHASLGKRRYATMNKAR